MKVIACRITLLEPALLTGIEGDPNESVSLNYIPGSVLRGALIRLYQQRGMDVDASNSEVRRLFFSGETRYLNAYPEIPNQRRALPTPLSWQRRKGEEMTIYDLAVDTPDAEDIQLQSIPKPFCLTEEDEDFAYLLQPSRRLSVHTARTRRFGRAMPENKTDPNRGDTTGAVYRYDALEEQQQFLSYILCQDQDENTLRDLTQNTEILIGGSRSSGYGRAQLEYIECYPAESWREVGAPLQNASPTLTVTLLSDVLIRNEYGQHVACPHAFTKVLSALLGVSLRLEQAFIRSVYVGGFNRKWGLPLPQAAALRMGSVLVYQPADIDLQHLRKIELQGVGERIAEGFGRVVFNWHSAPEWRAEPPPPAIETLSADVQLDPESQTLAQRLAYRRLQKQMDIEILGEASRHEIKNPPSRSQLMRLRAILRNELMQANPQLNRINDYLEQVSERNTSRRQFTRARVGSNSLLDWLKNCLQREVTIKPTLVAGATQEVDEQLRVQYRLRLIDAVLARAAKLGKQEGKTNE